MYSPCAHLCTTQKHFVNICEHQGKFYWWIQVGKMLRLHFECEQNVSSRNRLSTLHLVPQCSHHVITCFQRPSPPVTISKYNTVLMLLIDGAQLYKHKESSCWIYIWILVDLGPDEHYKIRNILPGGVIPSSKPPKDLNSFLFPGLAHVSVLQHEGLHVWDAYHQYHTISFLYLFLVLADALGMVQVSRTVGHHGRKGCRFCGLIGQNKLCGPYYYLALLWPKGFKNYQMSSHPDIDVNALPIPTSKNYKADLFMFSPLGPRMSTKDVISTWASESQVSLMGSLTFSPFLLAL